MKRPFNNLCAAVTASLCIGGAVGANAQHITDGMFDTGEWTGPNVNKTFFPQVGQSGGSWLYVEQTLPISPSSGGGSTPNTLFLMYDYVNSPSLGNLNFFDVFFEVNNPNDPADYLVRIFTSGNPAFSAYERAHGSPAPLAPNGSFDVNDPGWSSVSPDDLLRAKFQTAVGIGPSPNSSTSHYQAEFQLSIDRNSNSVDGLYSPEPAFWSASVKSANDPPISSGIFTLNPNGTTTVVPVFGPAGGPVQRPQDAVPEPGLAALAFALLTPAACAIHRKRHC